jgi:predicted RNA-binding Zn ribbon-like protein
VASVKRAKKRRRLNRREELRAEQKTREARVSNLARLVDFVYATDPFDAYQLARKFLEYAAPEGGVRGARFDPDEISELQTEARKRIELAAAGKSWQLLASELASADPSFGFRVEPLLRPHGLAHEAANLKAITLWTLANVLGGSEGERLVACAEPGCDVLFIKRKRGIYCRAHRSGKEYARRHRQAAKESPELRHSRYVKQVARTKGDKIAAHVRKRAILKTSEPSAPLPAAKKKAKTRKEVKGDEC